MFSNGWAPQEAETAAAPDEAWSLRLPPEWAPDQRRQGPWVAAGQVLPHTQPAGMGRGWAGTQPPLRWVLTHDGPTARHPAHLLGGRQVFPWLASLKKQEARAGRRVLPIPLPSHTADQVTSLLPADPSFKSSPTKSVLNPRCS